MGRRLNPASTRRTLASNTHSREVSSSPGTLFDQAAGTGRPAEVGALMSSSGLLRPSRPFCRMFIVVSSFDSGKRQDLSSWRFTFPFTLLPAVFHVVRQSACLRTQGDSLHRPDPLPSIDSSRQLS